MAVGVPVVRRRGVVERLWGQAAGAFLYGLALSAVVVAVIVLVILLGDVVRKGLPFLSLKFLTSFPSRFPEKAGVLSALVGTGWLMGLTALVSIPLGVGAGIWLTEFAPRARWVDLVRLNIATLAGVPAIVYGLLGLTLFVRWMGLGRGPLAGALTVSLMILPVIVITAQEALRAVPEDLRQGAYALGATRWQVVRGVVLPTAFPSILTGVILALSRAIGEAAPLILIGALAFVPFLPRTPMDPFTVLPIQIFNWLSRPQMGFHMLAASGIIVLLAVLLTMNSLALWLRGKAQRRAEW